MTGCGEIGLYINWKDAKHVKYVDSTNLQKACQSW